MIAIPSSPAGSRPDQSGGVRADRTHSLIAGQHYVQVCRGDER
jgi:hypothetical protein